MNREEIFTHPPNTRTRVAPPCNCGQQQEGTARGTTEDPGEPVPSHLSAHVGGGGLWSWTAALTESQATNVMTVTGSPAFSYTARHVADTPHALWVELRNQPHVGDMDENAVL